MDIRNGLVPPATYRRYEDPLHFNVSSTVTQNRRIEWRLKNLRLKVQYFFT